MNTSCLNILQLGAILQMNRLLTEPFDGSLNHLGLPVVPDGSKGVMSKPSENYEHGPPASKESKCRRSQNEPAVFRQLIPRQKAKLGNYLPCRVPESNMNKVSQTCLDAPVLAVSEFQAVSSAAYLKSRLPFAICSTVTTNKLHGIVRGSTRTSATRSSEVRGCSDQLLRENNA